jgi:DNA-binding NarL/FixJ family response regulator
MSAPAADHSRVLLANLDPVVLLGMIEILEDGGVEVVSEGCDEGLIVSECERLRPDAVVLGSDGGSSRVQMERVLAVAPATKVILWARDEQEMEIFERGSTTPRRAPSALPSALVRELSDRQATGGT